MTFEVFRGFRRWESGPRVGISERGVLSLNAAAYALLGEPERVHLLADAERDLVALEPAEGEHHSYSTVKAGRSKSRYISARAFFEHYGISFDETQHFTPRLEGDRLIFEVARMESRKERHTPTKGG